MTHPSRAQHERSVEQQLVDAGHAAASVSVLVYSADDLTERLAAADPALAEAYLQITNGGA